MRILVVVLSVLLIKTFALGVYQVGDVVDNITFKGSTGGEPVDLTLYDIIDQGKIVWFDFSKTTCGPCRSEAPALEETWIQFGKEDGPLSICATITDIENWNQLNGNSWREAFSIPLTYWLSTGGELGQYHDDYNGTGAIPYNVIIGADYKVLYTDSGYSAQHHDQLVGMIANQLDLDLTGTTSLTAEVVGDNVELHWDPIATETITEYWIYDNSELIDTVPSTTTTYTHQDPETGLHNYVVKGYMDQYAGILTDPSEFVEVMVGYISEDWLNYGTNWDKEMCYDGQNSYEVAMDFDLDQLFGGPVKISKIKTAMKLALDCTWRIVEFTDKPTNNILGGYEGVISTIFDNHEVEVEVTNENTISGKIAIVLSIPPGNGNFTQCMDNEISSSHSWIRSDGACPEWTRLNVWFPYVWNIQAYGINHSCIETELVPTQTQLFHNCPNPFNPTTNISFKLDKESDISLVVYNSVGEEVVELLNSRKDSGIHSITFDGSNLNSGVYFYKLSVNGITETKKMVLAK